MPNDEDYETEYLDIFDGLDKQVRATKLFGKIFEAKKNQRLQIQVKQEREFNIRDHTN